MARRVKMSVVCVQHYRQQQHTSICFCLPPAPGGKKKNYLILDVAPFWRAMVLGERGRESVPVVGRRWSENLSHSSSDITSAFLSYIYSDV